MEPVWILIAKKVVADSVTLLTNYLLNQLPTLRAFPGKNRRLVLMLVFLVVLSVAHEMAGTEGGGARIQVFFRGVGVATFLATLHEVFALWQNMRRLPAPQESSLTSAELLKSAESLEDLHDYVRLRVVKKRLDFAVGEKAINVSWEQQQAAVGRVEQLGGFFPKPKLFLRLHLGNKASIDIGENILKAFHHDDVSGKLLILGSPGMGKTTVLLKLAEALTAQFKTTKQVPYIFELSTWQDDQDILDWLKEQLRLDRGIDPKVSHHWITCHQLLPLLDGLDELGIEQQKRCADKINEFAKFPRQQLIVCCRSAEYAEGQVILDELNCAIYPQPLSRKEIKRYLRSLNRLDLWDSLNSQPALAVLLNRAGSAQEAEPPLLQIPLFLQMLVVAHQDGQKIGCKADLLKTYVAHKLDPDTRKQYRRWAKSRRKKLNCAYKYMSQEPSLKSTEKYLRWLAIQANHRNIPNNFMIERMQPNWLASKSQERLYRWIVLFSNALFFSLIAVLLSGLMYGIRHGLIVGLMTGLTILFIDMGRDLYSIKTVEAFDISLARTAKKRKNARSSRDHFIYLIERLVASLSPGLAIGLMIGLTLYSIETIPLVLTDGLVVGSFSTHLIYIPLFCALIVLTSCLLGFFDGILNLAMDDIMKPLETRKANQGIFTSVKNFGLTVLSGGILAMFMFMFSSVPGQNYSEDWKQMSMTLIFFTVYWGFYKFGGLPVVQHTVLRSLLHGQGNIPRNYTQFLKYTTERRLTQQIGGRFRFIHRELLDYFAAMDADASGAP